MNQNRGAVIEYRSHANGVLARGTKREGSLKAWDTEISDFGEP